MQYSSLEPPACSEYVCVLLVSLVCFLHFLMLIFLSSIPTKQLDEKWMNFFACAKNLAEVFNLEGVKNSQAKPILPMN